MANPTSRATLKEYCLRRLGKGVIDINVSDDQVEDRVDEALQFYQEYHYDGVERVLLKHKITATTITFSAAHSFTAGNIVYKTTAQKDVYGVVYDVPSATTIRIVRDFGTFAVNDIVSNGAVTSTISAITLGDISNKYIPVNDSIIGIIKIFNFSETTENDIFSFQYQFRMNSVFDMTNSNILYYDMVQKQLALIDFQLTSDMLFRYNRNTDKLYLDIDWNDIARPDEYIMVEAYKILNPADAPQLYNDMFLKRYLTALIKRQWGANLSKFVGITMPGGVTLNGSDIYQQADEECKKIEEEMQNRYELPVDFMVG